MVIIENPILNSPYREPDRHHELDTRGYPTGTILPQRRKSTYITPIPQPRLGKKSAAQPKLFEPTEKEEENYVINQIRAQVKLWRERGWPHITRTTRQLLDYWTAEQRDKKLFFCQIEALETVIYITEAAKRDKQTWIEDALHDASEEANPGLYRMAFKMATGSGKTVVMAMLIAWQALNKLANPNDGRFTDAFLIITPGVTIRDRLQVLRPSAADNYYDQRDLVPAHLFPHLYRARIVITNYHAFLPRELVDVAKLTKDLLSQPGPDGTLISPFTETPEQVARRVCRGLGDAKNIIVINDEAHHCYATRLTDEEKGLKADDRKELSDRRVWSNGIRTVAAKLGVRVIYDLSATPFFLAGSGFPEGRLFPWVISDFALIDAIESGIVKIPRLPVADDVMAADGPTYRELWPSIRDALKRRADAASPTITLPQELEGALTSLYGSYERYHAAWADEQRKLSSGEGGQAGLPPPVLIVVCSDTRISKLIYDWISGYEREHAGTTAIEPGRLPLFRNEDGSRWHDRPTTLLVDSRQLESGDGLSDDFKRAAAHEIDAFKRDLRQRDPSRDPDALTETDLLREVMNTVGQPGKLGESVKCVVSVSMLTEGWDVRSVTHILGVRAFSTQLICEQVVGRALRRISYEADADGRFDPEYAEVYGVPFSFLPTPGGAGKTPRLARVPTAITAQPEREGAIFTFPNVIGYRTELGDAPLTASFTPETTMELAPITLPTRTENAPLIGAEVIHDLAVLHRHREQEVVFTLARHVLHTYFTDPQEGEIKPWYFPQLIGIVRRWLAEQLTLKGGCQLQQLLIGEYQQVAAEKIHAAIMRGTAAAGTETLRLILDPAAPTGSSSTIAFETRKDVYRTSSKCPTNYIALDSLWEAKLAQTLEWMPEVAAYVKNEGLNLRIPYVFEGIERAYIPDFLVRATTPAGRELTLIVEVSGERRLRKDEKDQKISTTRDYWLRGVHALGQFGQWDVIEIDASTIDDAAAAIRRQLGAIDWTA